MSKQSKKPERTCIYCGCTNARACPSGCSWLVKHKSTPTGVCSSDNCVNDFMLDAGKLITRLARNYVPF